MNEGDEFETGIDWALGMVIGTIIVFGFIVLGLRILARTFGL